MSVAWRVAMRCSLAKIGFVFLICKFIGGLWWFFRAGMDGGVGGRRVEAGGRLWGVEWREIC